MRISIILEALTGSFETDMARGSKAAQKAARETREAWKQSGVAIGTALAAAAAALTVLTKRSIDSADEMAKMAQKVGISVESLSTLAYTAGQAGVEIGTLQSAFVKLTKGAADAALGTGEAIKGFDALGISVKDAEGNLKNSDVLLKEVSDKFATFEDGANKTALAVALFGRAGANMIPVLNQGSEAIEEMEQRARDLGVEMDTGTAKAAERFNDNLDDIQKLAKGLGNDLARELLPTLNELTGAFIENGIQARKGGDGAKVLADAIKTVIAVGYTAKAAIEAVTNAVAAYVDVAFAAGKAVLEISQNTNPLTMAWRAANGELKPLTATLAEFQSTASTAFAAGDAGIDDALASLTDNYERIFSAAPPANDAIMDTGKAAKGAAPGLRDLAKEQAAAEKALKAIDKEWSDYAKVLEDVKKDHKEVADSYTALQERFKNQAREIQFEIDLLGMDEEARNRAIIAMQAENLARDESGKVIEEQRQQYEALLTELAKGQQIEAILIEFDDNGFGGLIRDIELLGEAIEHALDAGPPTEDMLKHIDRMKNAFGGLNDQLAVEMVGSFGALLGAAQTFTEEGSSGFKAMEKGMAALSIIEDVLALKAAVTAVLTQGKGDPYSAFARMAAMAAAVAPMLASIGLTLSSIGGGGSGPSAAQRQESQGTGTILGDAEADSESAQNALDIIADATSQLPGLSRGMLNALQSMQAALGGASNLLARGAGDVAPTQLGTGASIPSLTGSDQFSLLGRAFGNIFGGKESLRDQGVLIVGGVLSDMIDDIMVQSYATIHRSGGWFSSSRNFDRTADLGDEVAVQFQLVLDSMADAVREGAEALGLNMQEVNAAIDAYRIEEIRISTMDLSAEEAQAELAAVFSSIFDGLAGDVVPFIDQFQMVGEGLGETLIRVATGVQVTQEAMRQLGFALDETDPERFAQISEGLIGMTGGIDEFIAGMQTFVRAFATEEHQFAVAQDEITRAFEQFGLTIPETRDAMWALMQSLDATTAEGQEQIATLLNLAGVADSYYTMLEQRAESAEDAARQAAEAEAAAAQFIGDLLVSLQGQLNDSQRAIDQFDMTPLAIQLAQIEAETAEALNLAEGAGDVVAMTIAMNGMQRSINAVRLAALEFNMQLEEWSFEDALTGMTELEQQIAQSDRVWQERLAQAIEIFGEESEEAARVTELWGNATERFTEAAAEAAQSLIAYTGNLVSARGSIQQILQEARIGVQGDGLTEQQRAIAEVNQRFAQFERALRQSLNGVFANATARRIAEEQVNAGLIELAELRLEALANLEAEWADEIAAEREALYEQEMEWIRRLQGIQDSLLLDPNLSTLTPAEMLAEAQAQYDSALAGVQAGDLASRDLYESALMAYLEQARDFYSSSQPYLDIFDQILANNQGLIDAGITDLGAQVAADALAAPVQTVDELRGLREDGEDQTMAVVEQLSAIQASQTATLAAIQTAITVLREIERISVRVGP